MNATPKNYTPLLQRILKMAEIEADRSQDAGVCVHHLLVALWQEGGNVGSELLAQNGLTLDRLRNLDFSPKVVQPQN